MGMRPSVQSATGSVDKYLGTSYDDVAVVAENIEDVIKVADSITELEESRVIPFDTLDEATNSNDVSKIFNGAALNLKERSTGNGGGAMWDVVPTSSVVPNGSYIVQSAVMPSLSLKLRSNSDSTVAMYEDTPSNSGADAMISDLGYLKVDGNLSLTDITIDEPIIIKVGGFLTSQAGNTVTIRNTVSSTKQFIFRGEGLYSFENGPSFGEESRYSHVRWFNATTGKPSFDNGVVFQKMTDSMGNAREALIDFDTGTYYVQTKTTWNRATMAVGNGDRLTNIWVTGGLVSSGDVWDTAGQGCNFKNFQFNADSIRTNGAYIRLLQSRCKTFDIQMDKGEQGIVLQGLECEAHRTKGLTWASGINSSLVEVQGDDCLVSTVNFTNTGVDTPESVVKINATAKNVLRPIVNTVKGQATQFAVQAIVGDGFIIEAPEVNSVLMRSCSHGFRGRLIGTGSITDLSLNKVRAGAGAVNNTYISIEGAGDLVRPIISDLRDSGLTDSGLKVEAQSTGISKGMVIGTHTLESTLNGVFIAGAGSYHEDVAMTGGVSKGNTDGYEFKVLGLAAAGLMSSGNVTGFRLVAGSDQVQIFGVSRGDVTPVASSGGSAVTITIR